VNSAEQMWSKYMQLNEAEASFRVLKERAFSPALVPSKEPRIKSHVLVAFLGYSCG